MKIYAIAKNERGIPKTAVRYGLNGDGKCGYCLKSGRPVFFTSFAEANRVLMSFDEPHWYDIVEFESTNKWEAVS